ncbi:unnamed protein product [Acanthoscelides obtectus]|nr:unnamed protein product [Acanthoscelides obtectus]CAK1646459.1 hypothetical protein AOBTE_LOCUS14645 [Acanthoscelides obtectus]
MNTALTSPNSLSNQQSSPPPPAPPSGKDKEHAHPAASGKNMHPQGAQATAFGQSQNVFPNMNAAHSHPNAQQNHFSMGSFNMGAIQPSNHPVASQQQSNAGGPQLFNPSKSGPYSATFQGNIVHQTHQNQTNLPPVSQALPPTSQQHSSAVTTGALSNTPVPSTDVGKPQANGTSEVSSAPTKVDSSSTGNHVSSSAAQPAQTPPGVQKQEKSKSPISTTAVPEHPKPQVQDQKKPVQETPQPAPALSKPSTQENGEEKAPAVQESLLSPAVLPILETPIKPAEDSETLKDTTTPTVTPTATASTLAASQPEQISTNEKNSVAEVASKQASVPITEPSQGESRMEQDLPEAVEEVAVDAEKSEEPLSTAGQTPKKDPLALPTKPAAPAATATSTPSPVRAIRKAKTVAAKAAALANEPKTPTPGSSLQRSPSTGGKTKRQRIRTQHYQSPLPEIEIVTKMTSTTPRSKGSDEKLIYFYK